MAYIYNIKKEDLYHLRKKEQFVLFLEKERLINIGSDIYFAYEGKKRKHKIIGGAKIASIYTIPHKELSKIIQDIENKKEEVQEDSNYIDLRDLVQTVSDNPEEAEFMEYLNKGYYQWLETHKKGDFVEYLIAIGYAENKDDVIGQNVPWDVAIMLQDIDIYNTELPLYFFSKIEEVRQDYLSKVKYCNDTLKTKCYQCPYIGMCISENVKLRNYPLVEIDSQITEVMYIAQTVTGLKSSI